MITALFAVDDNGGVGNNGGMPWPPNKEDFKWFRETTLNQIVVMGSKTWQSPDMPKPLPKRTNVVITSRTLDNSNSYNVYRLNGNVEELLPFLKYEFSEKEIFVIGGVNVLLQAKPVLDRIFITRIPGVYTADTQIDLKSFLDGFILTNINDLGTCKVEQYETISRRT